jgi:hypothetical protein
MEPMGELAGRTRAVQSETGARVGPVAGINPMERKLLLTALA